jgi:hypothetical protein
MQFNSTNESCDQKCYSLTANLAMVPNHGASCHTLGIFGMLLKSGVHWLGLRLFGATKWKLLIIEPFSQWKPDKIEIEKCIRIWRHSWCFWKDLGESNSIEFISQFSELRCGRYCFLSGFFYWKFKQITNFGFGRKNQLSPNVFTLGPTAQARLVLS